MEAVDSVDFVERSLPMWANFRALQLPDTDGIGCAARYDELLGKKNKSFRFKALQK